MKILILGGTVFLGRAIASQALAGGHGVTLFNRGVSAPDAFSPQDPANRNLTLVTGDRLKPETMEALLEETWDAVVDTCGVTTEMVANTEALIQCQLERSPHFRYVYISTIAVYEDFGIPGITESDTLRSAPRAVEIVDEKSGDGTPTVITKNPATDANSGGMYGTERANCERALEGLFEGHPANLIILRPSLLVGPEDPTDRLLYWVRLLTQPGRAIVPNAGQQFLQWVDVRDLAAWILVLLDRAPTETETVYFPRVFNVGHPEKELTLGAVWRTCLGMVSDPATLVPMDEIFLLESNVKPWLELPFWVPSFEKTMRGFIRMDTRKAERAGLVLRPISETLWDVFDWDKARVETASSEGTEAVDLKAGLRGDRQEMLLKAWAETGKRISPERAIAPVPQEPQPTQSQLDTWLIEGDD